MKPAVIFQDVVFTYPDEATPALKDVSLVVPEGTLTLVIGATGAGKSTLLRAVNGLVPHFSGGSFSGSVSVEGRGTLAHAPRDLADVVAFVPQDPTASFVLDRLEDEIAYGLENLAVHPNVMRRRVEEVLDLLDLTTLADRSLRTLSGGEKQRVAIAAALAAGPRILVLDEPTSQLDPQGAEDVMAALGRLVHDLGLTVILSEHKLERVSGAADLVLLVEEGRATVGEPRVLVPLLPGAPPATRIAGSLGWEPPPLTVREARRFVPDEGIGSPPPPAAARTGQVVLAASGLHAGYGSRNVLNGVSLDLREGEITALMGRNGSGKSTLLRCLAGLHEPSAGNVAVGDHPPQPGRDVALCPQAPESLLFKDSVRREVEATLEWSGAGDVERLLSDLTLGHLAERHPRDLSAGERLLVAAAATVATDAPCVLLDEPTRGIDLPTKEALVRFLRAYVAGGGTVFFATHDVEMVAEVADRVVLLARGEVIADGLPGPVLGDSPVFAPQMSRIFGPGWLTPRQVRERVRSEETVG